MNALCVTTARPLFVTLGCKINPSLSIHLEDVEYWQVGAFYYALNSEQCQTSLMYVTNTSAGAGDMERCRHKH